MLLLNVPDMKKEMQVAKLIHNPTAGDEEHKKDKLIELIEAEGFQCRYSSTKKDDWEEIENDVDFIIIAGGDGTVRKVVKEVLKRDSTEKDIPLALLPLGTANNFAKTLGIPLNPKQIIKSLKTSKIKSIDIGRIYNIDESNFFLESFGFGIFPYLMQVMKKREEEYDSPEAEVQGALKKLHDIILKYEARKCKLEIDDTDHSGDFILAEVMNTKSIGPNLILAPQNDPGDGELEVVLIPDNQKEKFLEFISCLIQGKEQNFHFHTLQAKKINISWQGTHVHVDDKIIKLEENEKVQLEIKEGIVHFLVPAEE
jgi:diacylglycerol kinase (ATP)